MNILILRELYEARGYDKEATDKAIKTVLDLEIHLKDNDLTLETANTDNIKEYVELLICKQKNTVENFVAIARYYYLLKKHDIYIYFTKILGGLGVIDNIKSRAKKYLDTNAYNKIFNDLYEPPLGATANIIPLFTKELMHRIQNTVQPEVYEKILAGNNHGIPEAAMQKEKSFYKKSQSLDDYLAGRHKRKVDELQQHCDSDTIWFEQHITQEVVDFVQGNQEILSAVKKHDKLYVTKIPYDTVNYLNAKDQKTKCYYGCHCPFAREAILDETTNIPSDWCYCSAGFAKFPFEIVLGRELDVKVIASCLKGDDVCRFEISLD